jgi:hypothetical protein
MLKYFLVFALVSWSASAQGIYVFFNFSEWDRLSDLGRSNYIAGAYDSLQLFARDPVAQKIAQHRQNCMKQAGMTIQQLAENARTYAKARPELQGGTAQAALIGYLNALCGTAQ